MVAELTQPKGEALERVPFEQYLGIPALHATALKDILTSPRLYRWRRDHPKEDIDAFRVGRAAHTAALEPTKFLRDYVLWEGGVRRSKKWDAFQEANGHKTILTVEQYRTAECIAEAILEHEEAGALVADRTAKREVTLTWTHPRTGLACKGRIDLLGQALVDIKTTRDPNPRKFSAAAQRYGYFLQLCFYADGEAVVFKKLPPPVIIAAQNVPPFDVVVFELDEKAIAIGHEQAEKAIDMVAQCTAAKAWPGIAPTGRVPLTPPLWAAPDYSEDGPDESQPIEDAAF